MARGHNPLWLAALLALALGASACGDDGGGAQATPTCGDPSLTYAGFGKTFLATYCQTCHGGSVSGDARNGAPTQVMFDSQAQVAALRERMFEQAIILEAMPFGSAPKPSAKDRAVLGAWLECGAP